MSVLIKGIDMPLKKAIAVVIHPDGTAYSAKMFAGVCTEYLADCTAVPVPPHGELIDVSTVNLEDGPYEYQDWVEWAWEQYLNAPVFLPADPPRRNTDET